MSRCVLLLFLCQWLSLSTALNIYVAPHEEQCYFEQAVRGEKVVTSFNVAAGGFLDINVKVYGPDGKLVYEIEKEREGSFQFIATQTGNYQLCFGNDMSTLTSKTVSFHLYVGHSLAEKNAAKIEHLTPLENSILQMSEGFNTVRDFQDYAHHRELICRSTNESTKSRVLFWSLMKYMVLIGVAILQIYYLKSLFEKKTKR